MKFSNYIKNKSKEIEEEKNIIIDLKNSKYLLKYYYLF